MGVPLATMSASRFRFLASQRGEVRHLLWQSLCVCLSVCHTREKLKWFMVSNGSWYRNRSRHCAIQ